MGMETPPTHGSRPRKPPSALAAGLSGTVKVPKPAHAVLNTAAWRGGGSAPWLLAPLAEQRTGAGDRAPNPARGAPVPERRSAIA